jgi:hypothetical protein
MSNYVVYSMRTLCCNSDFGPMLFDKLTPVDLRSLHFAFGIPLTAKQIQKYMVVWRQIFVDDSFFAYLMLRGFEVSLVTPHLSALVRSIRDPYQRPSPGACVHLYLRLLSASAKCVYPIGAHPNVEILLKQDDDIRKEFMFNPIFKNSIRYGTEFVFNYNNMEEDELLIKASGETVTKVSFMSSIKCTDPLRTRGTAGLCECSIAHQGWMADWQARMWESRTTTKGTDSFVAMCLDVTNNMHMYPSSAMDNVCSMPALKLEQVDTSTRVASYEYTLGSNLRCMPASHCGGSYS